MKNWDLALGELESCRIQGHDIYAVPVSFLKDTPLNERKLHTTTGEPTDRSEDVEWYDLPL